MVGNSLMVRLLASAALAALLPVAASAAIQTITINLTVVDDNFGNTGAFFGETGTATITYDDSSLVLGTGNMVSDAAASGLAGLFPEFDFSLNMFGQTFDDANDTNSFFLVTVGTPSDWDLSISEADPDHPTAIDDSLLLGFSVISTGTNLTETAPGVFSADVIVNDLAAPNVIPLPASVLFLGAALGGLGFAARRRAA